MNTEAPEGPSSKAKIGVRAFWYIVCEDKELRPGQVLARKILGEWLAIFRNETGNPVALQDRCLHRAARLSNGKVSAGKLVCPYHGWTYDGEGDVVRIPSEGPGRPTGARRCAVKYDLINQEGYIYVRLSPTDHGFQPFAIPNLGKKNWRHIRLKHLFRNNVTNCAENFVDIPHTVFVHPGVFRKERAQKLTASIERRDGQVHVRYQNETDNLGWFARILNPDGGAIEHIDSFYMPNITSVEYRMGANRHLFITSQSIPLTDEETLVYTDLTYNYGVWNFISGPIVRHQAKTIINQDVRILGDQWETIRMYGANFQNSSADLIHVFIESIQNRLSKGEDPRELPEKKANIEFWV